MLTINRLRIACPDMAAIKAFSKPLPEDMETTLEDYPQVKEWFETNWRKLVEGWEATEKQEEQTKDLLWDRFVRCLLYFQYLRNLKSSRNVLSIGEMSIKLDPTENLYRLALEIAFGETCSELTWRTCTHGCGGGFSIRTEGREWHSCPIVRPNDDSDIDANARFSF